MVLTADEIINGISKYEEIEIDSLGDSVYLRALSKGEWNKCESIRSKALGDYTTNEKSKGSRKKRIANIESQLSFNIEKNNAADYKAQVEAIYMSMDNSGYNDKKPSRTQIEDFPADVFDEIYENVKKLTGVDSETVESLEDDVDEFPENK